MSCKLEPTIWSHYTCQRIPCFDRCQLIIAWMSSIKLVHGKPRLYVSVNLFFRVWQYFFDIGHPCYDQLTPVKTRYLLTSITWSYCRLKFSAHRGHVFLWSWPLNKGQFFYWIADSCQVCMLKTGQDCSKAGLRIKSWPNNNTFFYTCFLLLCFVYMVIIETQKKAEEKPHHKVTKLKSKF